ncbi:uncharacterized protein [Physeter macrocephalus]|uniref:Uncharacterized protein n=1 Tax=Physeter macrocephalus TaxID=9755 RepID=A0A9W2WL08_PHYMC|nr:uncharacterized protein LOC102987609 [Physeter catodon]
MADTQLAPLSVQGQAAHSAQECGPGPTNQAQSCKTSTGKMKLERFNILLEEDLQDEEENVPDSDFPVRSAKSQTVTGGHPAIRIPRGKPRDRKNHVGSAHLLCRCPGVSGRLTRTRPEASPVPPGAVGRGRASGSAAVADLVPQHLRAGAAESAQKSRFPRSFHARGFPRRCVLSHERFVDLKRVPTSHLYTGGCVLGLTFVSALPRPAIVTAPQLHTMAAPCLSCSHMGSSLRHEGSLVAVCRLLSCSMHAGSSSLTRNRTRAPCIGNVESTHWTTRHGRQVLYMDKKSTERRSSEDARTGRNGGKHKQKEKKQKQNHHQSRHRSSTSHSSDDYVFPSPTSSSGSHVEE